MNTKAVPVRTLRPTTGWVAVDLYELVEFKDLILEFARRDIKLRYRQTVLGIAWVVLQPIVAAGVLNFAFGIVAGARPRLPAACVARPCGRGSERPVAVLALHALRSRGVRNRCTRMPAPDLRGRPWAWQTAVTSV